MGKCTIFVQITNAQINLLYDDCFLTNGQLFYNQWCAYNYGIMGAVFDEGTLGEMAGEIAGLLRGRAGFHDAAKLTTNVGTVTTGSGTLVQVFVSDTAGNALLSVSVELHAPRKSPQQLTLINTVHH